MYLRYIYDTYGAADPSRERPDRSPPVPLPPPEAKNREQPERPDLAPEGPATPKTEQELPPTEVITPQRGAIKTPTPSGSSDGESAEEPTAEGSEAEPPEAEAEER